jgi:hypothetical protein
VETFRWARNASSLSPLVFCESKAVVEVGLEISRAGQGSGHRQTTVELFCNEEFMVGWTDRDMDRDNNLDGRFLVLQYDGRPRTPHVQPAIIINPLYQKDKGVE